MTLGEYHTIEAILKNPSDYLRYYPEKFLAAIDTYSYDVEKYPLISVQNCIKTMESLVHSTDSKNTIFDKASLLIARLHLILRGAGTIGDKSTQHFIKLYDRGHTFDKFSLDIMNENDFILFSLSILDSINTVYHQLSSQHIPVEKKIIAVKQKKLLDQTGWTIENSLEKVRNTLNWFEKILEVHDTRTKSAYLAKVKEMRGHYKELKAKYDQSYVLGNY